MTPRVDFSPVNNVDVTKERGQGNAVVEIRMCFFSPRPPFFRFPDH